MTAAGTELADAYSPDTIIASSPGKEVHDPWAFYLHAALLRQAFAHCGKFPTAASRRSLGCVLVLVWLIILSDQLLIIALNENRHPISYPRLRSGDGQWKDCTCMELGSLNVYAKIHIVSSAMDYC
ncbi:UNVERIFIED_CONTAM: hypothetical protein Sradi_7044500 [Sesamum radiatum]|uniref:Uncharacterized protein n=1 Tax=Sesamum radiatum TaxID=300843 RepID=A0AAW2JAF3_SESRA